MSNNLNHIEQMQYEMELRTFAQSSKKHYLSQIRLLEKYFDMPCTLITPSQIKEYLHYRIKSGISYSNIDIACNAFKIMFNTVLNRNWSDDIIIRPKKIQKLPVVLSRDEIIRIFSFIDNVKYKAILTTAYSAGLRISEVLNLKVTDIDSKNMSIKVNQGKGNKDRFSILGKENLNALRNYYKLYKPSDFLFPGATANKPLTARHIQATFKTALLKSGIKKMLLYTL